MADSNEVERRGIALCDYKITSTLGWIFRDQPTSDYGIDAHVEVRSAGSATGRLVGLQIKTGHSYISERLGDSIVFRPKKRHVGYWLGHSLPTYILLVDLEKEEIYWQALTSQTLRLTDRGAWTVHVPKRNLLTTAAPVWSAAADGSVAKAQASFTENLRLVPPGCANRLQELHAHYPDSSAMLVSILSEGRFEPKAVLQTLLEPGHPWIHDLGVDGFATAARYAAEHEIFNSAAEAYERAARLDTDRSAKFLNAAGFSLIVEDRNRSRTLLTQARSLWPETPNLSDLGLLLCDQLSDAHGHPFSVSSSLLEWLERQEGDVLATSFLANQASRSRSYTEGVALWRRAVQIEPTNAEAMAGLVECLGWRARTTQRQTSDLVEAIELVKTAHRQVRTWAGPTSRTLSVLVDLLTSIGDFDAVLEVARTPPDGLATESEARDPHVASAAVTAALALGKTDLADRMVEELPAGVERSFQRAQLKLRSAITPDELKAEWQAVLAIIDEGQPEYLIKAVSVLAKLGLDYSDRLIGLVQNGLIEAVDKDNFAAVALARTDKLARTRALRLHPDSSVTAAINLIETLADGDTFEDALIACDDANLRFSDPILLTIQFELLHSAKRFDEARPLGMQLVSHPEISGSARRHLHYLLAAIDADRSDWTAVELHLRHAIDSVPSHLRDDRIVWQFVEALVLQRDFDRASRAVLQYQPSIVTAAEGRVWLQAMHRNRLNAGLATQMLLIASRFEDNAELSGAILTHLVTSSRNEQDLPQSEVDSRPVLPDDLRRRAFEAVHRHASIHGDDSLIKMVSFGSPDEFIEQLSQMLQQDDRPVREVTEMVLQGRAPLGMLASAYGRTLTLLLASRDLGMYISGARDESEIQAEVEAARVALGNDVVIDASSLIVANCVAEFGELRAHFRRVLLGADVRDDVLRGSIDIAGVASSAGFIGWSSTSGGPQIAEASPERSAQAVRRLGQIESSLLRVTSVSAATNSTLFPEVDSRASEAWLGPIKLAAERQVSLWSDDLAIRRLARLADVATFGTLALLEHLRDVEYERATEADDAEAIDSNVERRRLDFTGAIRNRVVDVPISHEDLLEIGRTENFPTDLAFCTVARVSWWQWSANSWLELREILHSIVDQSVRGVWTRAAMQGVCEVARAGQQDAGPFLAGVALIAADDGATSADYCNLLNVAGEVGKNVESSTPANSVIQVSIELTSAGVVGDLQAVLPDALRLLAQS